MKRYFFVALFIAILAIAFALSIPIKKKTQINVIWQSSQSAQIRLGVRDKLGELGNYTAVFKVTDPKGNTSEVTRKVQGDDFPSVNFPEDFLPYYEELTGKHRWKCFVGGKAVVGGSFEKTYNGFVCPKY